jgi:hypothetical protein
MRTTALSESAIKRLKVHGHRFPVVRNQQSSFARCRCKDCPIRESENTRRSCGLEVYRGLSPKEARDDLRVEVLVRQKLWQHYARGGGALRRFQFCVEKWVGLTCRSCKFFESHFTAVQIFIDFNSMREVIRDSAVNCRSESEGYD